MDMTSWWKEKQPNYNKIFSALTLTSPELTSELHKLEEEEQRKENLHQKALTNLLPWETHEVESKILEEECKDSILNLSKDDKTFISSVKPEEEAVLPELLIDFDLDLHFSLIKRMLAVDPNLVEMQAQLSGAGAQEKKFWKNYFQRCALIRKQVGMDMNEIWGRDNPSSSDSVKSGEEIVFSRTSSHSSVTPPADNTTNTKESIEKQDPSSFTQRFGISSTTNFATSASNLVGGLFAGTTEQPSAALAPPVTQTENNNDFDDSFEIIKDKVAISYGDEGNEDDLDDLEAEIAKELES